MELKHVFRFGAFGLLLAAVGGCYEYTPPPSATMSESYTQRKQDGADRLLDDITDLTLADAQRIAIKNNPTYIAAFHAVNAARMRYLQAWGAYSPTVGASFSLGDNQSWTRRPHNTSGTPSRTESITTSTNLSVNWMLFDGLAREFNVLIYKHNFNYQKLLEDDEARTMMQAVAYAYNTVLLAIENKRIAEEDRKFQESSLRDTRLKYQAGAVPLGKTNMDQFATGLVGVRSPYGAAPNRLAPGYVSGGSSSGSAAALAYGLCSFSLGTDTAGSGRVPAAFNELVGVKPSRGVLSCRGSVPACRSLDCVSLFARNLEDADILLKTTAQFDPEDAYSRVLPERAPLPLRWKFGVPRDEDLEFFGCTAYQEAFQRAVTRMEDAGGEKVTIDFSPFLAAARLLYEGPWVFERYAAVGEFIERHPESVLPVIRSIITPSATPHPAEVFRAMYRLQECRAAAEAQFAGVDLLLTPTAGTIYRIEEVEADPIRLNSNLGYYTNYMNLLDFAALAIPAGRAAGLPFGVTLVGRAFDDRLLLEAARRFRGAERYPIAVCGAHLAGMALHSELEALGARFLGSAETAPCYRMFLLENGPLPKPALLRTGGNGSSFHVELYDLTAEAFARFVARIPPPLGLGTLELKDGRRVSGFIGEAAVAECGRDISEFADWRAWVAAQEKGARGT